MSKAFTIFEILIVAVIIIIITSIGIASFSNKQQKDELEIAVVELVSIIREAQNMTISGMVDSSGSVPNGYGVYVEDKNKSNKYIFFSDQDVSGGSYAKYKSGKDIEIKIINFTENIEIINIEIIGVSSPSNNLHIFFAPPEPLVYFEGKPANPGDTATITLQNTETSDSKNIIINQLGKIDVQNTP